LPSITEILRALREEPTLEHAARRLGMPVERLRLYAAGLAGSGLAKIQGPSPGCDCSTCPLAGLCTLPFKRPQSGRP